MITVKKPEACTGCSICEMACSFHHIRQFSRSYSSIRVHKNLLYPGNNFQISISVQNSDWNPFCDLCNNEDFKQK